ncbi:hypothetical protein ABH924_003759 [Arthrobacter sp. GAS37]|uniref:DUF4190 domain-containing protein n=1 Tax=Arthrobacter sp. GAS37 TaxID=3156261 RepID=UPI0038327DED
MTSATKTGGLTVSYPNNQPPQGYPAYVQGPVFIQAQPKGMSVASMVLGLVSIFFGWTFLVPLLGLILGLVGIKKEPAGKGMAITGIILNGLMIAGWVFLIVLLFGGMIWGTTATINSGTA